MISSTRVKAYPPLRLIKNKSELIIIYLHYNAITPELGAVYMEVGDPRKVR